MLVVGLSVGTSSAQAPGDEQQIRSARAASNAAIAKHDVAGISSVWMDTVHVTSSTSALGNGRAENEKRMADQFERRRDTVYVRAPSTIEIYAPWLVAAERGEWIGKWSEPDGVMEIGGTYLAQWRKIDGRWLIQSELYVPTHCKGSSYCTQHP